MDLVFVFYHIFRQHPDDCPLFRSFLPFSFLPKIDQNSGSGSGRTILTHSQVAEKLVHGFKDPPFIKRNNVQLWMEEILHQLIGDLSHYLQGFNHPRWCRVFSIHRITHLWMILSLKPKPPCMGGFSIATFDYLRVHSSKLTPSFSGVEPADSICRCTMMYISIYLRDGCLPKEFQLISPSN